MDNNCYCCVCEAKSQTLRLKKKLLGRAGDGEAGSCVDGIGLKLCQSPQGEGTGGGSFNSVGRQVVPVSDGSWEE